MIRIDLPDGDCLILYGLSASAAERGSIVRLHSTGRRRWTAHPLQGEAQDAFVAMQLGDGALIADSFQGVRMRIDLDSGAVEASAVLK